MPPIPSHNGYVLPAPPYREEGITIYRTDCRNILPHLPAASFDALITDPPYGIGFKYSEHDDTPVGYGKWLWGILEQCERLLKPGSPCLVWQAMLNCRHFSEWFPREYRILAGCKNFVQMYPGVACQHAFDPIILWYVPGERYVRDKKFLSRDWHIANNAVAVTETWALSRKHPCPRPLDQVEYFLRCLVRPGGVVLDPFFGSGTTGVACLRHGYMCVGIEKDPAYFDVAVSRVEDARGAGTITEIRKQISRRAKRAGNPQGQRKR